MTLLEFSFNARKASRLKLLFSVNEMVVKELILPSIMESTESLSHKVILFLKFLAFISTTTIARKYNLCTIFSIAVTSRGQLILITNIFSKIKE